MKKNHRSAWSLWYRFQQYFKVNSLFWPTAQCGSYSVKDVSKLTRTL